MNFPPVIFDNPKFSSILSTSHPNQYASILIESQNILKKLLKFETKEKNNFQSNVINWLKQSSPDKLIKYFSFNSLWFTDILKEMYIIAKYHPNPKFIYNPSTKNIQINLLFFNLFENNKLDNYNPRYNDYFYLHNNDEDGVIDLGKKSEKENIQIKFLEAIRYLTLPKNKNEEKNFYCYNNVVTVALDYLYYSTNFEKFIDVLLTITKNEIFKNPIEIETQTNSLGNKYLYNIKRAKWLNSPFTLTELLCSYFEQSVLINYEYFLLYNQEISGIYYNKLDEHINNIFKLVEFIGNMNEKKVEIFKNINQEEIYKTFNNKSYIKEIIDYKKSISDDNHLKYNPHYKKLKLRPKKEIITSTLIDLENLFIKSDLGFVAYMTFIKNSIIFTQDDFVIKIVYDMVNDFWKKKTVEDLLNDYTSDKNKERNNSNNNKKKKKKKKKKNKNKEDLKDEENKNKEDLKNEDNKNDENIINEIVEKKEEIIENNIQNIKNEETQDLNKENNLIINVENKNNQLSNDIKYLNKEEKESSEENNDKEEKKETKEEQKETKEEEEEKKEEKNFFLFPVVKNKKKKNKNKKKDKKHNSIINNINNILELNGTNASKSESTKSNSNLNHDITISKDNQPNLINSPTNKKEKEKNIINNSNQAQRKPINKFNMNLNKNLEENNTNNDKSNGNKGFYHSNKRESNIFRTKENDKYLLAGSNFPGFTSFNFKSKKKKKRKSSEQKQLSFEEKKIIEFSKEIIDNTQKVNKNKEILQQIRKKYIKKTYQNINIFLKNEKVDFLCAFYGSNISGLSIENSDIDIMVKIRKNKNEINYISRIMDAIVNQFKIHQKDELSYIKNMHPIYTASIPVIKLECDLSYDTDIINEQNNLINNFNLSYNNLTKLLFDITFFEVEKEEEKIPSELMIDYIKQSTQLYPQIFDIIYIMKKFLFNRKLNQSYQGGISSFSLFLLILSFLKFKLQQKNSNNSEIYIGSLLIEFLKFYSDFDFYNSIIRPNEKDPNDIYLINDSVNNFFKYNINIVDPITGLNVAKSTFKIEEIKKAFKDGFDIIIGNLYKVYNPENFMNSNKDNNNKTILEHLFYDK